MGLIIERHQALQRILRPYTVVVPYAERLAGMLADDRVETRRAFPHLISTVQASALLHQRQRQIDEDGRLIATADDYQLARHLLAKPLGRLLGERLSDPARRFLERLQDWYGLDDIFTAREATRQEKASKSSVYGWIGELHDGGFLQQAEAGEGVRRRSGSFPRKASKPRNRPFCPRAKNCSPIWTGNMETNRKPRRHKDLGVQMTFCTQPGIGHKSVLCPVVPVSPENAVGH